MTGVRLSRSTVRYFRHNDVNHLESLLEGIAKEDKKLNRDTSQQRRFIVVEGVYRNIGDVCPLKEIISLKEKYFYRLILDETYSFGLLGKTGKGLTEHLGIHSSDVEIIAFTLDTVLAGVGGICVGNGEVIDHQRLSGAGYCFSASLAPFLASAAIAALNKIEKNSNLLNSFHENANKLYNLLKTLPHVSLASKDITGLFHLILDIKANDLEEAQQLQRLSDSCLSSGVFITLSKYPLLHSKTLRPSLMICVHVHWNDATLRKIHDALLKAIKQVFA
jgi:serine palmitoyltransferase